ncbi:protein of unknown function [Serratia sp. Tan611]|nr:protein of unknown function [Serratia sp. Tan611]
MSWINAPPAGACLSCRNSVSEWSSWGRVSAFGLSVRSEKVKNRDRFSRQTCSSAAYGGFVPEAEGKARFSLIDSMKFGHP